MTPTDMKNQNEMELTELILKMNEWFKNHSNEEINEILGNLQDKKVDKEYIKLRDKYFNQFLDDNLIYTDSEIFNFAFDAGYELGKKENISNVTVIKKEPKFHIKDLVLCGNNICEIIDYNEHYNLPYQLDNGYWVTEEMLTPYGNS